MNYVAICIIYGITAVILGLHSTFHYSELKETIDLAFVLFGSMTIVVVIGNAIFGGLL